jgi:hypothetical protein
MVVSKQDTIKRWRKDKRKKVDAREKQAFCTGCRQNWYNRNKEGGCWHLKGARLKERDIYMSLHNKAAVRIVTLSCFIPQYH